MSAKLEFQETPYELFSLESLFPDPEEYPTLLAYKASADPDTIYMHKAMKEPDAGEFNKAMRGEMDTQIEGKVLELTHINDVPKNATRLGVAWRSSFEDFFFNLCIHLTPHCLLEFSCVRFFHGFVHVHYIRVRICLVGE